MELKRLFKCAECNVEFEQPECKLSLKCPECRCKILILLEGPSLKSSKSCGGNCAGCTGCG